MQFLSFFTMIFALTGSLNGLASFIKESNPVRACVEVTIMELLFNLILFAGERWVAIAFMISIAGSCPLAIATVMFLQHLFGKSDAVSKKPVKSVKTK